MGARKMIVGQSDGRTPFKHFILDAELGRLMGIFGRCPSKVPALAAPFHIIDLCAGDGYGSESSPAIIQKHIKWGCANGVDCYADLIEKDANTFDALSEQVDHSRVTAHHADASDIIITPTTPKQAIFIHADPNHIIDMPISDAMIASWTVYTTFLITLGCNVGGIKRLPLTERKGWFDLTDRLMKNLPPSHDLLLVSLVKDSSQWAYLVRLPRKWGEGTSTNIKKRGSSLWPKGVTSFSYVNQRAEFDMELLRLFLRKEELEHEAA